MRRNLNRIPIPLMLALAVAVGVAVTIVIQIVVLAPPPAVVFPIETSATSLDTGSSTYSTSVAVPAGHYAVYPTLAGLGKIRLQANTTGWYYLQNEWVPTVVRRSTGDAVFSLSGGHKVYVKEINTTHAFVFFNQYATGVVARKVQVGSTGWIVYHPVAVDNYDDATKNAIINLLSSLGYANVYVFQPRSDYVEYDLSSKTFYVYFDVVNSDGTINMKSNYFTNTTSFEPVPTSSPVTVNGIERINMYNYVLFPVWALLYYSPTSNVKTALTVTPTQ
jgi:hypothetical protein